MVITHLGASVRGAIGVAGTRHAANARTVGVREDNMGAAGANVVGNFGTSMPRHVCARDVASSDKDATLFPRRGSNTSAGFRLERARKGDRLK